MGFARGPTRPRVGRSIGSERLLGAGKRRASRGGADSSARAVRRFAFCAKRRRACGGKQATGGVRRIGQIIYLRGRRPVLPKRMKFILNPQCAPQSFVLRADWAKRRASKRRLAHFAIIAAHSQAKGRRARGVLIARAASLPALGQAGAGQASAGRTRDGPLRFCAAEAKGRIGSRGRSGRAPGCGDGRGEAPRAFSPPRCAPTRRRPRIPDSFRLFLCLAYAGPPRKRRFGRRLSLPRLLGGADCLASCFFLGFFLPLEAKKGISLAMPRQKGEK